MSHALSSATALWVEDFLTAKIAAGCSARTIEAYRHRLARFRDWLQQKPPDQQTLDRRTLRAYIAALQADPKLGPVTVAMYFRDVAVWCRWLVAEGELDHNPAAGLKIKIPHRRPPSYSDDHALALLAVATIREQAIIHVLLDTGLRVSELVSLRRDSIDWGTGSFVVCGKGNKEREGWLEPESIAALRAYLATRTDSDPALWYGRTRALRVNSVHQAMARTAIRAGIRPEVRRLLHSFRATFAKNYLLGGGDLKSLADLLGHTTITMAAHYAQLASQDLAYKKHQANPLGRVLKQKK